MNSPPTYNSLPSSDGSSVNRALTRKTIEAITESDEYLVFLNGWKSRAMVDRYADDAANQLAN